MIRPLDPDMTVVLSPHESAKIAASNMRHCLIGGARQSHQHGEDVMWLMGWADNAIELELMDSGYEEYLDAPRR